MLAWLEGASPLVARERLPAFAAQPALLTGFSEAGREQFLLQYYAKGSREELARFLHENEAWRPAAWPVELRSLLDGQRFEEAVRRSAEHYHVALTLPPAAPPEDRYTGGPPADASAAAAFEAAWSAGNVITARRVLDDAVKTDPASASAPDPEVWRLRAALAARDAAWPSAWQNLSQYLRATRNDVALP